MSDHSRVRASARRASTVVVAVLAYWFVVRPRMLNWGATPEEAVRPLPGDGLVAPPNDTSTFARTVGAPADDVWPWLVQMGQERGGFYSYAWAENLFGLGIRNVDRVVPEWQDRDVGDAVRLAETDRWGNAELEVKRLDPGRALVLGTPGDDVAWSWAFVVEPYADGASRLYVRSRVARPSSLSALLAARLVLEPVAAFMTQKTVRGIAARAERRATEEERPPTDE